MKFNLLLAEILFVVGFCLCTGRPTPQDDHVTMSGEPTHFQVDDKAAELEINANAMGVKVNAKPASLQVVSKPGAPSVPVAHPAVVVPQLPAPYLPAPFYPAPAIIGPDHVARRHHFFMDAGNGNYNYKKASVPGKGTNISKKSEISGKGGNSKKRQWIQRLPVLPQIVPYPQLTNVRVHPLVQQLVALTQGQARQTIPRLINFGQVPQFSQRYSIAQRIPGMMFNPQGISMVNSQPRNLVNRAVFIPPRPMYMPPPMATFMPLQRLPYVNPGVFHGQIAGYNGYYDPMISRDFVPDLGIPGMPPPSHRTFIPGGMARGAIYPGFTPLGLINWQRMNKRLNIPRKPSTKNENNDKPSTNHLVAKKKIANESTKSKLHETTNQEKKSSGEKIRIRRSLHNPTEKVKHKKGGAVAKRQFILTRPSVPQQQVVAYVPVVPNLQTHPTIMTGLRNFDRRNLVLNLPFKTTSAFVLKVPSYTRSSQMYPSVATSPVALYKPFVNPNVFSNQGNTNVMGFQRSGIQAQMPMIQNPAVQMPGLQRSGILTQAPRVSLTDLAGIQGQVMYRSSPHMTLYNTDPLPSQFQDQIFGDPSVEGRARIPHHRNERRHRLEDLSGIDNDYAYSEDDPYSEEDSPTPSSLFGRIDDQGSYTEQVLPDGRTVLKKDHVGFGPITVEAKTAESRDHADATDMDLDSDKRKLIPRPKSYLDKRLGIPKPEK